MKLRLIKSLILLPLISPIFSVHDYSVTNTQCSVSSKKSSEVTVCDHDNRRQVFIEMIFLKPMDNIKVSEMKSHSIVVHLKFSTFVAAHGILSAKRSFKVCASF